MVETVSQIAAREALKGKKEKMEKGDSDSKSDAEGSCQASKRSTNRRSRHRQRKKKKEGSNKDVAKDGRSRDQQDGTVADRIIYDLDFERCMKMVVLPSKSSCQLLNSNNVRRKSLGGCSANGKKQYRKPQPALISDGIVKVEDMSLESKKADKRKMRQSKKSELIRQGQSGWAGACFDRSPSPSLLPMPPSVLLERACCQLDAFNRDGFEAHFGLVDKATLK